MCWEDSKGFTPLMIATHNDHEGCVELVTVLVWYLGDICFLAASAWSQCVPLQQRGQRRDSFASRDSKEFFAKNHRKPVVISYSPFKEEEYMPGL